MTLSLAQRLLFVLDSYGNVAVPTPTLITLCGKKLRPGRVWEKLLRLEKAGVVRRFKLRRKVKPTYWMAV